MERRLPREASHWSCPGFGYQTPPSRQIRGFRDTGCASHPAQAGRRARRENISSSKNVVFRRVLSRAMCHQPAPRGFLQSSMFRPSRPRTNSHDSRGPTGPYPECPRRSPCEHGMECSVLLLSRLRPRAVRAMDIVRATKTPFRFSPNKTFPSSQRLASRPLHRLKSGEPSLGACPAAPSLVGGQPKSR